MNAGEVLISGLHHDLEGTAIAALKVSVTGGTS
jgi:hypothetical protein